MKKVRKIIIGFLFIAIILIVGGILIQVLGVQGQGKLSLAYDDVGFLDNHLYAVLKKNKIGYVNKSGKQVIAPQYDLLKGDKDLSRYQEQFGKIPFVKNNQFGLLDETGKVLLDAKYPFLKILSSSSLIVSEDNKWFIIDSTGKKLTDGYDSIEFIENSSFVIATLNQQHVLLSNTGKVAQENIESIYPITDFKTNKVYYVVKENNRFSLLKEKDEQVEKITLALETPPIVSSDTIYTINQNTTVLYDLSGHLLNSYPTVLLGLFKNDVTLYLEEDKVGVYSESRGKLTDAIYSNNLSEVNDNGYMFASRVAEKGKILYTVVNPMGDKVFPLQDDKVLAMIDEKYIVFLNSENTVEIKTTKLKSCAKYQSFEILDDNLYLVSTKDGYGVINQKLEIVIPLKYEEVRYHNHQFYLKTKKGYEIIDNKKE